MATTELHLSSLSQAAADIPSDRPVVMLNLLRFRQAAAYPSDSLSSPCTGAEAYMRYRQAFGAVAKVVDVAVDVVYAGAYHRGMVAGTNEGEKYDMVALVKYPSFADFRKIVEDPQYLKDAQPHRIAALEEWKLYATTEV